MTKKQKKRGPKFKKRRAFNREEAFPKKVAQEKMADEMVLYQHMVMSINRAFPDRDERIAYIQMLIDAMEEQIQVNEEEENVAGSESDAEGNEEEAGEGESGSEGHNGSEAD